VGREAPATSFSFFSACVPCDFLKARLPPPVTSAEGLARALALLHAAFDDVQAASALRAWGFVAPTLAGAEEEQGRNDAAQGGDAEGRDGEQASADDLDGGLDLGPTARRRMHPNTYTYASEGARASTGRARHFLQEDVLRRSLRSTREVAATFCKHDVGSPVPSPLGPVPLKDARDGGHGGAAGDGMCPDPAVELRRQQSAASGSMHAQLASQHMWTRRVRQVVTDKDVAAIIVQSELEDLAYNAWGPRHACAMLERCLLPVVS